MGIKEHDSDHQGMVVTKKRAKNEEPKLFKVLLHNDDYTTMDFVIMVLQVVFRKNITAASEIMMNVHKKGVGVAGLYTREIAETKVAMVQELARKNEHPLRCSMERA